MLISLRLILLMAGNLHRFWQSAASDLPINSKNAAKKFPHASLNTSLHRANISGQWTKQSKMYFQEIPSWHIIWTCHRCSRFSIRVKFLTDFYHHRCVHNSSLNKIQIFIESANAVWPYNAHYHKCIGRCLNFWSWEWLFFAQKKFCHCALSF